MKTAMSKLSGGWQMVARAKICYWAVCLVMDGVTTAVVAGSLPLGKKV